MSDRVRRTRLETQAVIIGYAMSRLDRKYLDSRSSATWKLAFEEAARALSIRPTSFKNLRDEFDPVHGNRRKGWHKRPLRPNRQRVLGELCEVSDDALLDLVARILNHDEEATAEAIDSLVTKPRVVHNVAERLLTGRRAEEFFLANTDQIVRVKREDIIDVRQAAAGFDFGVRDHPENAIEIKGMKQARGEILFTDREWFEAKNRRENYWLVVIGNLATKPVPRVIRNPNAVLEATCRYQASLTAVWRSAVSVLS